MSQLEAQAPGSLAGVKAVTFATQTNSFVLLDADNRPLTPIILWPDERALQLADELHSRCSMPEFLATTGVPAAHPLSMPGKLLWIQREDPHTWKKARRICLISDYLTWLMTGQHVTEAGAAGLTSLLDIHRCRWWSALCARLEIPQAYLPRVVRAGTDLGSLGDGTADSAVNRLRFGLSPDCRFVVGCLDQYAGAIGAGNVAAGSISETTGTALATIRCADEFNPRPAAGVCQGPAFSDGLSYQMAVGAVSANYLEWYRGQLPGRPDFDRLMVLASRVEPGAGNLRLRTDRALTGNAAGMGVDEVFEGRTPDHTPGHMVRCILEAVASSLREQVTALSGGVLPSEIRSAGGGARSDLWLQIKADTLGIPVRATECPEPTSLGAAIFAEAVCSGKSVTDVAGKWVRLKPPHVPCPRWRQMSQSHN